MFDDEELILALPRSMIERVRDARRRRGEADAAFADVRDRGERNAAEANHAAAVEELVRAEAALVRSSR